MHKKYCPVFEQGFWKLKQKTKTFHRIKKAVFLFTNKTNKSTNWSCFWQKEFIKFSVVLKHVKTTWELDFSEGRGAQFIKINRGWSASLQQHLWVSSTITAIAACKVWRKTYCICRLAEVTLQNRQKIRSISGLIQKKQTWMQK